MSEEVSGPLAAITGKSQAIPGAELHEPPKIWLPKRAVVDGKVAVIGADNRVHLRGVQSGDTRESMVEIRGGLRDGERVVTDGVEQLEDGQLVRSPES